MTKKSAFTLAEVLITLGIIGVVAAMTIPTLIANTNSAKFRSQYKKAISTLNQAGLMAQAQYDMDFAAASDECAATTDSPSSKSSICALLNGTLAGYSVSADNPYGSTKNDQDVDVPNYEISSVTITPTNMYFYTLADGVLVAVPKGASGGCTVGDVGQVTAASLAASGTDSNGSATAAGALNKCIGFIDVNGTAAPNKESICGGSATNSAGGAACTVPNDAAHLRDIYPIVFHNATVEPITPAGKGVLAASK